MSLVDQTNRDIPLSIEGLLMTVDVDSDSSFDPPAWVDIDFSDPDGRHAVDDESVSLTLEEAGKLHDRLELILGRVAPASAYSMIRARISQEDVGAHVAADIEQIICETGGDFGCEALR